MSLGGMGGSSSKKLHAEKGGIQTRTAQRAIQTRTAQRAMQTRTAQPVGQRARIHGERSSAKSFQSISHSVVPPFSRVHIALLSYFGLVRVAEASPEEVDAFDLLKCLTHGGDMPGSVSPLDVAEKGFVRVRLAEWEGGVGWGCKEEEGGRGVMCVCMKYSRVHVE